MTEFSDWRSMPPSIKAHLDELEQFIGDVDSHDIDDGTVDAEDTVKAVNGLVAEIERLRVDNERLRQIIVDAAEAIERGSTASPVVECLRAALEQPQPSTGYMTPEQVAKAPANIREERLRAALLTARGAILRESAVDEAAALNEIDTVLGAAR